MSATATTQPRRLLALAVAAGVAASLVAPPVVPSAQAAPAAAPESAGSLRTPPVSFGLSPPIPDGVGLVDPTQGLWHLRNHLGQARSFYFGNPGDFPIMGDWNCNGVQTPGMYRQSDGFVYLRNSNTQGIADIRFFFGNPGDIPIAGDFNGNGCDTVSIYRPSTGQVFVINKLGQNDGGLGAAEFSYFFGNPGDKPFTGDFNGNGITTVGLHRESTGFVYFRNSHTQGNADNQFFFGNPGDRLIAGDWTANGVDSPGIFRPGNRTVYLRYTNTQGNADEAYPWGMQPWIPVSGKFGALSSGVTVSLSSSPPAGARYAVESLYLQLPAAPFLPEGLHGNLAGLSTAPKTMTVTGSYSGRAAFGGHVAVVRANRSDAAGTDIILLVSDDGAMWRVVGAHMVSYGRKRWFGPEPRFIAIIGGDRAGHANPLFAYADSVHVISLVAGNNPPAPQGAVIGFPRDTVVRVPYNRGGTVLYCTGQCDQLNRAMVDKGGGLPKGPGVVVQGLKNETGWPIQGYMHIGMGSDYGVPGFTDLVDAYIAAHSAFKFLVPYDTSTDGGTTAWQESVDGRGALSVARERQSRPRGDIDRTLAQGLLIKAAIANVKPLGIQSAPALLDIMDNFVNTNLKIDDVLTFAASLFILDPGQMPTLTPQNLITMGSKAYDLRPGSLPNIAIVGCSETTIDGVEYPRTFAGSFAFWLTPQNRQTLADLNDGILHGSNWQCLEHNP